MKLFAILAAGGFVLAGTSLSSAAGARPVAQSINASHLGLSVVVPGYRGFAPRHFFVPLQTGGASATATGTPAPTVTPTGPTYPDASTLVTSMVNKLELVKTLKFKEITDAQQPGVETVHIQATGVATCSGPALYGHVTGTDTVLGTSQKTKLKYSVIEFKNKYFAKSSSSKNKWSAIKKVANIPPFAPDTGAILICSTSGSGSSGGSGSTSQCQIKDLVNLGPGSIQGTATWKLQAIEVCISGTDTTQATLGFEIEQKNYLLLVESVAVDDTTNNVQETFRRERSNFGLKVSVKKPVIGSTKPK
jgi:hypothetical protein